MPRKLRRSYWQYLAVMALLKLLLWSLPYSILYVHTFPHWEQLLDRRAARRWW
jgi:hypothetical protein